jgi:hypothetical protein
MLFSLDSPFFHIRDRPHGAALHGMDAYMTLCDLIELIFHLISPQWLDYLLYVYMRSGIN